MKLPSRPVLSESDIDAIQTVLSQLRNVLPEEAQKRGYSSTFWETFLENCLASNRYPLAYSGYNPAWDSRELFEMLLKAGLDVNVKDEAGYTPLIRAVEKGRSLALITLLVEHGANVLDTVSLFNKLNVRLPPRNALQIAEKKNLDTLVEYLRPLTEQAQFQKTLAHATTPSRNIAKRL